MGVLFVDETAVAGLEQRLGDANVTLLRASTEAEARELTRRYPTSVVLVDGADGLAREGTAGDAGAPWGREGSGDDAMARFLELLPDAFCVAGPDGRFLRVNGAFERMLGWSREELLSMQFAEHVHPEDVAATARKMGQLLTSPPEVGAGSGEQRSFTDFENRLMVRDGGWRRVVWTSRYFPDEGVIYAIARDVTAERAAMERLHHSEAVMAEAQAIGRFGSWELDLASSGGDSASRVLRWSDETFRIFGHEPGAFTPSIEAFFGQVHPEDRAPVSEATDASLETGERYAIDHRIVLPDGSVRHVHEAARPSRDPESGLPRLVGTVHDVTARKEAEARLREQATLLDEARDAILVRDLEGRVVFWNRSAERLYGWAPEEAIGRLVTDLIYKDLVPYQRALTAVIANGEWAGELNHATRDGRRVIVEGRWTLVRGEGGEPRTILVINTDVTERKKLEAQYLRAQRMESIGTLAGGIAHDLNNVLAPILMAVDLLRLSIVDPSAAEVLSTVETSARRGADLVQQVLSFARGVDVDRVVVDPRHLVRDVSRILIETMPRQIVVETATRDDVWGIVGDPTQLHQVLINLCVNARDAMPDGGTLRVATDNVRFDEVFVGVDPQAKPGLYVTITVSDTGHGMSPDVLARAFEPFFTTKAVGKGTGLGLATVQAIVKSHGGWIATYSELGQGSTFRVYLPAAEVASGQERGAPLVELPRGDGELILVVDDEAAIRMITQQTLEAFGYRAITAQDGAEALALFVQHQREIALVLTDMMMPIMDGPATIRALLRLKPDVRIIAASGLNANGGVAKAAGAGVRHFLPKPYTTEALLKTVAAVLRPERDE